MFGCGRSGPGWTGYRLGAGPGAVLAAYLVTIVDRSTFPGGGLGWECGPSRSGLGWGRGPAASALSPSGTRPLTLISPPGAMGAHTRAMIQLTEGLVLGHRFLLSGQLSPPAGDPAGGPARDTGGVWVATDVIHGGQVAIKVLRPHRADVTVAEARFRLIARTLTQLLNPAIARVLDYGELGLPGGLALPYVARDLVPGPSLAQRLAEGPLGTDEALRVAAAVADALSVAHRAGVVHGRVHPGNILLGPEGVRVTDFGLAALGCQVSSYLQVAGAANGLPGHAAGRLGYIAPEVASGAAMTPAADVYSLGVLFVSCLTGGLAVAGSRPSLTAGHGGRRGAASLSGLWAACLADSPQDRPGAAHVAVMLRQVLGDPQTAATSPQAAAADADQPAPPVRPSGIRPPEWATAASSRSAPRPAVPATRWPG